MKRISAGKYYAIKVGNERPPIGIRVFAIHLDVADQTVGLSCGLSAKLTNNRPHCYRSLSNCGDEIELNRNWNFDGDMKRENFGEGCTYWIVASRVYIQSGVSSCSQACVELLDNVNWETIQCSKWRRAEQRYLKKGKFSRLKIIVSYKINFRILVEAWKSDLKF